MLKHRNVQLCRVVRMMIFDQCVKILDPVTRAHGFTGELNLRIHFTSTWKYSNDCFAKSCKIHESVEKSVEKYDLRVEKSFVYENKKSRRSISSRYCNIVLEGLSSWKVASVHASSLSPRSLENLSCVRVASVYQF